MPADSTRADRDSLSSDNRDRPSQPSGRRQVYICHNTTCRKEGAEGVFRAFADYDWDDVDIRESGCMGCCGNGPMVLVQPDNVRYRHVRSQDVDMIVHDHLQRGQPVQHLIDPNPPGPTSATENSPASGTKATPSLLWPYIALGSAIAIALGTIAATVLPLPWG